MQSCVHNSPPCGFYLDIFVSLYVCKFLFVTLAEMSGVLVQCVWPMTWYRKRWLFILFIRVFVRSFVHPFAHSFLCLFDRHFAIQYILSVNSCLNFPIINFIYAYPWKVKIISVLFKLRKFLPSAPSSTSAIHPRIRPVEYVIWNLFSLKQSWSVAVLSGLRIINGAPGWIDHHRLQDRSLVVPVSCCARTHRIESMARDIDGPTKEQLDRFLCQADAKRYIRN